MRVYLIRHGETDYNLKQRMQGHGEVPLNDRGIAQAARLAQRLAKLPLDHIYASDLRRATMTASIIAAATGTPIEYDIGFRERDPGPELTGKPYEESRAFFDDPDFQPPGGESVPVFAQRIATAFTDLIQREKDRNRTIAVVTHGMVCGAFLRVCLEKTIEEIADTAWPNASLTIADYNGAWNIQTLGDASHLQGLLDPPHGTGA